MIDCYSMDASTERNGSHKLLPYARHMTEEIGRQIQSYLTHELTAKFRDGHDCFYEFRIFIKNGKPSGMRECDRCDELGTTGTPIADTSQIAKTIRDLLDILYRHLPLRCRIGHEGQLVLYLEIKAGKVKVWSERIQSVTFDFR